jgi:hypothetical protein
MKHDNAIVRRQPEVAFDPGTDLQSCGEGEQAILGKMRAVVQAAVRESRGPGV